MSVTVSALKELMVANSLDAELVETASMRRGR